MELSKKTTILFPPNLFDKLSRLARQRGVSVGELVRKACEAFYRIETAETRRKAVQELSELSLPVGEPREMKEQSVPPAGDLLP